MGIRDGRLYPFRAWTSPFQTHPEECNAGCGVVQHGKEEVSDDRSGPVRRGDRTNHNDYEFRCHRRSFPSPPSRSESNVMQETHNENRDQR